MTIRNWGRIVQVMAFTFVWTVFACDSGGGDDNPGQTGNDSGSGADVAVDDGGGQTDLDSSSAGEQDTSVGEGDPDTAKEPDSGPEEPLIVNGVPAPGSACPIPEPWGYAVGDTVKNMAFKDCAGNPVTIHDVVCGSSVGWVYFTYGW